MSMKNMVVRAAIGAMIAVAGVVPMAGIAAAAPQQVTPVLCTWGGDGPVGQRYCDKEGETGSASGSGFALGEVIGRLLFGGR